MAKKTVLETALEMHQDLRHALSCTDGCDKSDIRDSFLIQKITELQERIDVLELRGKTDGGGSLL